MEKPVCNIHGTTLICPRCIASKGGKSTAKKHSSKELSKWGKQGGRGNKKPK